MAIFAIVICDDIFLNSVALACHKNIRFRILKNRKLLGDRIEHCGVEIFGAWKIEDILIVVMFDYIWWWKLQVFVQLMFQVMELKMPKSLKITIEHEQFKSLNVGEQMSELSQKSYISAIASMYVSGSGIKFWYESGINGPFYIVFQTSLILVEGQFIFRLW